MKDDSYFKFCFVFFIIIDYIFGYLINRLKVSEKQNREKFKMFD